MKKLIIILLGITFSGFAMAQESKYVQISKQIISQFQKNEYTAITSSFDETMKNALPAEKLKSIWESLNAQYGKYQKSSAITEDKFQNYQVVYLLCHFEKINLNMKTVFSDKNQVAGLFFIPEGQK